MDKILSASIYSAKHFAHFRLHTSLLPLLPQLHLTKSLAHRPEQDHNKDFLIKVPVAVGRVPIGRLDFVRGYKVSFSKVKLFHFKIGNATTV